MRSVLYNDLRSVEITFVRPKYYTGNQFLCSTCDEICWRNYSRKSIDVLTRKQLTLRRTFHQKGDIYRLYVPCVLGGRGLLLVEDAIVGEEWSLSA